ncbi:MAG: macro domain-containing protein [Clostridia bacterium]|nr:macro domain-containing protein [Clostridia bacterium]MBQ8926366.1 macro domain-containing protein [Clostridia bacterium]
MPFEIVRNDIVKMQVDAVVNTANPHPVVGTGVDTAIHNAAGPELLKAREEIGDIKVCEAVATPAFDLPAKYVIHVVGPAWVDENPVEEEMLKRSYRAALNVAAELKCESIAFPLLSTGNYGFPKSLSLRIALDEFSDFLLDHEMDIYLTVFGEEAFKLSNSLFKSIQSYIDENYVASKFEEEYGVDGAPQHVPGATNLSPRMKARREAQREYAAGQALGASEPVDEDVSYDVDGVLESSLAADEAVVFGAPSMLAEAIPDGKKETLTEMLDNMDAGFSETLLMLIDMSGEKDSDVYNRACVSRQLFSKIRNNPNYTPKKPTAVSLALALHLDLEETQAFIAHAGYTLTKSSKFDVIIMYCIENKIYNVVLVDELLHEFDQSQLGGK